MSRERSRRVEDLFQDALDRAEAERKRFLDEACAGDEELRREVEELLFHHSEATEGFLDTPVVPELDTSPLPVIGPYQAVRVLGEGGMGTVYLAEQEEPISRRVALKVIQPGLDSRQVLARFESERRMLALMEHPGIARVIDAGTTEAGRPYFVMDYVDGEPITKYCDRKWLGIDERVELLIQVCEAVQHAHQKGIIHRDLKPSNILISEEQGKPVPKIIDFGVAKAVEGRGLGERDLTRQGQILGTPEFMSPEQTRMAGEDVDTRTDVYALGTLAYVLLVGVLPFEPSDHPGEGLDEILNRIRSEEPMRPSARATLAGARKPELARRRGTTTAGLSRGLASDLDWIVMRALEKDRERRYGTVSDLAADLARYLKNEPVSAGPPSGLYRARKFARRNRSAIGLVTVFGVLLAGFALSMAVQATRVARERDRANRKAETSQQVAEFLQEIFEVSNPSEALGNTILARTILDRGAARITSELHDQPLVQAELMRTIGSVYRRLGLYQEAEPLLRSALDTQRTELGAEDGETLESEAKLANLLWRAGHPEEAEALLAHVVENRRARLGPEHPSTLDALGDLGVVFWELTRYADAESIHRVVLEANERTRGPEHPATLTSMNNLATDLAEGGKLQEAEVAFGKVLELRRRVLGDEHPETLMAANNYAFMLGELSRPEESAALYRETLAIRRRVLGEEHQETLTTMNNLASVLEDLEQVAEAESLSVHVVEVSKRVLGPRHPRTLKATGNLSTLYVRTGRLDEALPLMEEQLAIRRDLFGEEHRTTLTTVHNLGVMYRRLGRLGEAESFLKEAVRARSLVLGEEHPDALRSHSSLGSVYVKLKRWDEAERHLTRAYEGRQRVLGEDHRDTVRSREALERLRGEGGKQ